MMHPTTPTRPRRQTGASARSGVKGVVLVEVLVALLIFLLGVLGFIGMQTMLTKVQTDADLRANAAYLANEVIGRMWSDMSNLGGYDGTDTCSAANCTEWRSKVAQTLPGGTAAITVDTTTGNVSIKIGWTLPGGNAHHYETQSNISAKSAT